MNVQVSPEDKAILDAHLWHQASTGYIRRWDRTSKPARLIGLHREIMGDPKGMVVDHINGDPADNRRENLRVCSQSENNRNSSIRKSNRLGVKGVYLDRRRGTYRAQITVDGKQIAIGCFGSLEEAKAAYEAAAHDLHGQFARLK